MRRRPGEAQRHRSDRKIPRFCNVEAKFRARERGWFYLRQCYRQGVVAWPHPCPRGKGVLLETVGPVVVRQLRSKPWVCPLQFRTIAVLRKDFCPGESLVPRPPQPARVWTSALCADSCAYRPNMRAMPSNIRPPKMTKPSMAGVLRQPRCLTRDGDGGRGSGGG